VWHISFYGDCIKSYIYIFLLVVCSSFAFGAEYAICCQKALKCFKYSAACCFMQMLTLLEGDFM
jgi:hypothetical protein